MHKEEKNVNVLTDSLNIAMRHRNFEDKSLLVLLFSAADCLLLEATGTHASVSGLGPQLYSMNFSTHSFSCFPMPYITAQVYAGQGLDSHHLSSSLGIDAHTYFGEPFHSSVTPASKLCDLLGRVGVCSFTTWVRLRSRLEISH